MIAAFLAFSGTAIAQNELKIAQWEDVNTFDPAYLTSNDRELTIMRCLYNGLVKYKEGTWEIIPDLAESWEVSDDGKMITFKLRKGVMFHKGFGEFTAEDVKFSFERIVDPEQKSTEKGNFAQLERVDVIDPYTARLVLKDRMAQLFTSTLPSNTGMIVSKKAVEKAGREKYAFNPVGTGPYELDNWEPKKHVKLKAFDKYWGPRPFMSNLSFIPIVEDTTCETALTTGEIHIGRVALINAKAFSNDPKIDLKVSPALIALVDRFHGEQAAF